MGEGARLEVQRVAGEVADVRAEPPQSDSMGAVDTYSVRILSWSSCLERAAPGLQVPADDNFGLGGNSRWIMGCLLMRNERLSASLCVLVPGDCL